MKGLLIKDIRLMIGQKFYYLAVVMMVTGMIYIGANPSFVVGYSSILCMMFVISSCSYDEFDNGYPFLLSLPFTRKEYVREKYVFALILGVGSGIFSMAVIIVYHLAARGNWQWKETLGGAAVTILLFQVMIALLIPLQLKYGSEKGRMVQFMVYGGIFAVIFIGVKVLEVLEMNIGEVLDGIYRTNAAALLAVLTVAAVSVVCISMKISERIMEKKEF